MATKKKFLSFFAFYFFKLHLHNFSKIKSHKEVKKNRNQGFSYLMIEGSVSVPCTNGSGSGSATLLASNCSVYSHTQIILLWSQEPSSFCQLIYSHTEPDIDNWGLFLRHLALASCFLYLRLGGEGHPPCIYEHTPSVWKWRSAEIKRLTFLPLYSRMNQSNQIKNKNTASCYMTLIGMNTKCVLLDWTCVSLQLSGTSYVFLYFTTLIYKQLYK